MIAKRRSSPTCTARTRSRSPPPPAGSCAPASMPGTCGRGARPWSARSACTSSWSCRCCASATRRPAPRRHAQLDELDVLGAKLRDAPPARRGAPAVPALTAAARSDGCWWRAARYARGVVPLELVGVRVEVPANTPMVLLRETDGRHRLLPIYIGSPRPRRSTTRWRGSSRPDR